MSDLSNTTAGKTEHGFLIPTDQGELPPAGVKRIDPEEFRQRGYLQEVNRQFLHPLGLALEVVVNDEGRAIAFGGVWDDRDDPEGTVYGPGMIDETKVDAVGQEQTAKAEARQATLGYVVQGVDQ